MKRFFFCCIDLYEYDFQVLFVGRVKVSHSKVPPSFIDEALSAFKLREKTRQRHVSGDVSKVAMSFFEKLFVQTCLGFMKITSGNVILAKFYVIQVLHYYF